MREKQVKHHIDSLAALLLFGVFAACVLVVLFTGADAYRRLTSRDQAAYERRTGVQYIATRVRQSDHAGGVAVEPFGDGDALVLGADETYAARVYCYDGWLMELYCLAEEPMEPQDGQRILEAEKLALSLEDGLLEISLTAAGGAEDTLRLALRSGEEAAG
nr:DUF4860 domain-containing protein [uncultured Oscillibacter sp.]